jgi:hypothetical protein
MTNLQERSWERHNGMITCPRRAFSRLALMRCWEYQKAGCSCSDQATSQEIDRLLFAQQRETIDPLDPIWQESESEEAWF